MGEDEALGGGAPHHGDGPVLELLGAGRVEVDHTLQLPALARVRRTRRVGVLTDGVASDDLTKGMLELLNRGRQKLDCTYDEITLEHLTQQMAGGDELEALSHELRGGKN